MFERFTRAARQVVVEAQEEARELGHDWIGTEHLLLAAVQHADAPGAATLARAGVTHAACRRAVARTVGDERGALGPEDAEALRAFGIDLGEVRRRTESIFGGGALDGPPPAGAGRARGLLPFIRRRQRGGRGSGDGLGAAAQASAPAGHIRFAARAKKTLELALREAAQRKDRHIGVEHVVLALLRSEDRTSQEVFRQLALTPGEMRGRITAELRRAA